MLYPFFFKQNRNDIVEFEVWIAKLGWNQIRTIPALPLRITFYNPDFDTCESKLSFKTEREALDFIKSWWKSR